MSIAVSPVFSRVGRRLETRRVTELAVADAKLRGFGQAFGHAHLCDTLADNDAAQVALLVLLTIAAGPFVEWN